MKETFKECVSAKLRGLRAEYNLKQSEVAKKANVDVMTITRYENNSTSMQLDMIEKIINVYGLDLFIFFNSVSAKKQNTSQKKGEI